MGNSTSSYDEAAERFVRRYMEPSVNTLYTMKYIYEKLERIKASPIELVESTWGAKDRPDTETPVIFHVTESINGKQWYDLIGLFYNPTDEPIENTVRIGFRKNEHNDRESTHFEITYTIPPKSYAYPIADTVIPYYQLISLTFSFIEFDPRLKCILVRGSEEFSSQVSRYRKLGFLYQDGLRDMVATWESPRGGLVCKPYEYIENITPYIDVALLNKSSISRVIHHRLLM